MPPRQRLCPQWLKLETRNAVGYIVKMDCTMKTKLVVFATALIMISGLNHIIVQSNVDGIPLVKAPIGPMKFRPELQSVSGHSENVEYALTALAAPFIKDAVIRKKVAQAHWCGTPTMSYLFRNPYPSREILIERAGVIEARFSRK